MPQPELVPGVGRGRVRLELAPAVREATHRETWGELHIGASVEALLRRQVQAWFTGSGPEAWVKVEMLLYRLERSGRFTRAVIHLHWRVVSAAGEESSRGVARGVGLEAGLPSDAWAGASQLALRRVAESLAERWLGEGGLMEPPGEESR